MIQFPVRCLSAVPTVMLLAGAFALVAAPSYAQKVRAASATVAVDDASGHGMQSDALATGTNVYADGVGGLSVAIAVASGDLVIQPNTSGRYFSVKLGSSTHQARGNVVVGGIGLMAVSTTPVLTFARINFGTGLPNHVLVFRPQTQAGLPLPGATLVCATRTAVDAWRIETPVATESGPKCGGVTAPAGSGAMGGVFTEVSRKGSLSQTYVGTYSVPFGLTVTCTANCPQ